MFKKIRDYLRQASMTEKIILLLILLVLIDLINLTLTMS